MNETYSDLAIWPSVLGSLFYHDPASESTAAAIAWLKAPESASEWPFGQPDAGKALERARKALSNEGIDAVHKAYNRLFIGPYRLPAPPWASVYLDPESVIFGNETLELRDWMRACGVKMTLKDKEPEDQFGLMLMMLSWSVQNDVSDEDIRCLLEKHLLPWAPHFLQLFREGAQDAFYEALADVALATLSDWQERHDLIPEDRPLSR